MKNLILNFGVALAFSVAGFLYSHLRTRRIRPSRSPHSPPSSGDVNKVDSDAVAGLKEGICSIQVTFDSGDDASVAAKNYQEASSYQATTDNYIVGLSPSSKHSGEEEGFLLPEFNELFFEEFESTTINTDTSPRKDVETAMATKKSADKETEQEIVDLRNMVEVLQERERNLEIQLLEYYGLKEQEIAVMELQNQLKINNMGAKLFTLKIESLQAANRKLEAQVANYSRVMAELESARAEIKLLKRKIKYVGEENKELLSAIQQRVANLQDQEHLVAWNYADVQKKLQRLNDLEEELVELERVNSNLRHENSELVRKLESTQILASSVLEDPETEALQEANHRLRQENEDLKTELERLRADCCADVEELVYLRWVNACLRYELRNYHPPPGKTVARDLSKTLSPKSEEKAKKLILKYANSEGIGDKGISLIDFDFDFDCWSSHASNLTDSGGFDDISGDMLSATRTHSSPKTKIFRKLKSLVLGKDGHNHDRTSSVDMNPTLDASRRRESTSATSLEDMVGTYSCDTLSSHHNSIDLEMPLAAIEARTDGQKNKINQSQSSSSSFSDIHRLRNLHIEDIKDVERVRRNSDVGPSYGCKRMVLGGIIDLPQDNQHDHDPNAQQKIELTKFAEVLKGSRGTQNSHRKAASYSS